jgi:hypothetical protein
VSTDASDEYIAPIFRVENNAEQEASVKVRGKQWFLAQLIFSTLKMEVICSSETSIDTQRTTRHYIPEDGTLHNYRCKNLKSHILPFLYCMVIGEKKITIKHFILFRFTLCLREAFVAYKLMTP